MTAGGSTAAAAEEGSAVYRARLEQMRRRLRDRRTDLTEGRQVIENPETAAVSRGDEIAFLDGEIVNWNDGQVAPERLPRRAVVERHPHSALGPRVEKSGALGIFAKHPRELRRRNSIRDLSPSRAVVRGLEQIRLHVVELVTIA